MFYKRLREIDVPEMMASILAETRGKPWGFYRDMSRQLWDEARHAMMGEVGFRSLGVDWTAIPINFTWSLNLNTQLTAQERHAVLFYIEQGLMPRTGKRYEWEVGTASGNPLSGVFQDFDWADEVLHAQIGRQWYVPGFSGLNEAARRTAMSAGPASSAAGASSATGASPTTATGGPTSTVRPAGPGRRHPTRRLSPSTRPTRRSGPTSRRFPLRAERRCGTLPIGRVTSVHSLRFDRPAGQTA